MQLAVGPGVKRTAESLARRSRHVLERDLPVITDQESLADAETREFVTAYAFYLMANGASREAAITDGNTLGSHLHYMANHELHNRKSFWVDASLAWMLCETELDIEGDLLRLPFPCCAYIFSDPVICGMGDALLALDDGVTAKDPIRAVTVYWLQIPGEDGARGLRAVAVLDYLQEHRWPYMLARDLKIDASARLDAILESCFAGVDRLSRDPVFTSPELKRLLRLAINAVLYSTSADVEIRTRQPPPRAVTQGKLSPRQLKRQRRKARAEIPLTGDAVYFLPGKIDIRRLEELRQMQGHREGRQLMARFMVRGHWRRANPSWTDQRQRWIEPYWKGPEIAAIIERDYRLRE